MKRCKSLTILLCITLLVFVASTVFAGSDEGEKKDGMYTIGISIAGAEEYWAAMRQGCDAAAEKYDVKLIYMNAEGDVAKQVTHVGNLLCHISLGIHVYEFDIVLFSGRVAALSHGRPIFFCSCNANSDGIHSIFFLSLIAAGKNSTGNKYEKSDA